MRVTRKWGCLLATIWIAASTLAMAEELGPGASYTFHNAPGPNRVYVVAFDRLHAEYKLKVGWPHEKRNFPTRQPVSTIASLYHSAGSHEVIAAVNASFFSTPPAITGAAGSDGEMLAQPHGANETFLFGPTRVPLIREDVAHVAGTLTFADATTTALHAYNTARGPDMLVAYTPQWDASTRTSAEGIEVILADVSYPMRGDKEISGMVTAVRTGAASVDNAVPAGGMVLSAVGAPVSTLAARVQAGQRLRMFFDTSDNHFNRADMCITGVGWLLNGGAANTGNWTQYGFEDERHPRTVLAWNSNQIFLMVCDGRCPGSVGMTFQEMADFLTQALGATDAVNLDGGGSSTLWVNGAVRNLPSDGCGTERAVANAVLLVRESTATEFPFDDPFGPAGRLSGWDDKFRYGAVQAFSPAAPGGDGLAVVVKDPTGGAESMRRGDFGDADYAVQADIYCDYRPGANGFERYALFARDNGEGAMGLSSAFGSGNCYALTYDSNNGRIRAGQYLNGTLSDFLQADQLFMASTAWRRFRIECSGDRIRYLVNGALIADVIDTNHPRGYFGIGYHEFFSNNGNIRGTRADHFSAVSLSRPGKAGEPGPADGAHSVPLVTFLTWTPGATATSHDVYFGTVSPGVLQGNQTATTFDPGPLQLHRTYCWRIDEVNEHGTTTGSVWSFTTQRYQGDFDDDGDVDQADFGSFQRCLSGGAPQIDPACERAQFTGDVKVDAADLAVFLACMNGPGVLPPAQCLE